MRVLVVDDEPIARRRLIRMLQRVPDVEVVGQAGDGVEALERIAALSPDLILLDIRMPGLDGLAVAATGESLPPIVFTTAYNEHAVDAFEVDAVDYLLKPIRLERLVAALERVRARAEAPDDSRLRVILDKLAKTEAKDPSPVAARSGGTVRLFDPREIARFHASTKYTLFTAGTIEYVLDESLTSLEERLSGIGFLRVHRSELINLKRVEAVRTEEGSTFVDLEDGQTVSVSRRHAATLKRRLGIH